MGVDLTAKRRLPRWVSPTLGVACAAAGAVLITRPFTSLAALAALVAAALIVTGVSEVTTAPGAPVPVVAVLAGLGWTAAGVVVLAWPGITILAIAVVAGISMMTGGVLRFAAAVRGTADQRVAAALSGLASVVFGALALSWPDVTVLVIAVVFGARTVLFGLSQIALVFSRREPGSDVPAADMRPGGRLRHWSRAAGSTLALVVALALLAVSLSLRPGSGAAPGAFYHPPSSIRSRPGVLLRSEPASYAALPVGTRAWRILYTTTRAGGTPAVSSGIVIVPSRAPTRPIPVIAWAHGTIGVAPRCAPSLSADPFSSAAAPLDQALAHGWAVVATDYPGLGTAGPDPYLIGQGEARAVLDAVRAARQIAGIGLAATTVVWGHSQGGHAALWTGILAPGYAPDDHVLGVAAMAPAADLPGLVQNLNTLRGGAIFAAYVITAYSQAYSDVRITTSVRPGLQTFVFATARRCISEKALAVSVITSLIRQDIFTSRATASRPLPRHLAQNIPAGHIGAALLIAQGLADPLILPAVQARFVRTRCARGQSLEYRTYPGRDHLSLVAAGSPLIPDLIRWTRDRFARKPAPGNCAGL